MITAIDRPVAPLDVLERFFAKVRTEPNDCWTWTGGHDQKGYGVFGYEGRTWRSHRIPYTWVHGPVPAGLELDHLCRNRGCVNPEHIEAVTHTVNIRRGASCALRPPFTRCHAGHALTADNQYRLRTGRVVCWTCKKRTDRAAARRARARRT